VKEREAELVFPLITLSFSRFQAVQLKPLSALLLTHLSIRDNFADIVM